MNDHRRRRRLELVILVLAGIGLVGTILLIVLGNRRWYAWAIAVNFLGLAFGTLALRRRDESG